MKLTTYLGDGAYAHHDGWHVVLTTGHHDPARADNVIKLEPEVLTSLTDWLGRVKAILSTTKPEDIPDRA